MNTFHKQLREARIAKGLTQQQVADKINVEYSTIGHRESARRLGDAISRYQQWANAVGLELKLVPRSSK